MSADVTQRFFDKTDRDRQHALPVVHQAPVLLEARSNVVGVVGPTKVAEVRHPARNRHVAQLATAVDDPGLGEKHGDQAQVLIIIRHLVGDAQRLPIQLEETIEVPAGARIWPMNAVVPATTIWPPPGQSKYPT